MALSNTLKRIIFYGTFLAFLNYAGLSIAGAIGAKTLKKQIQKKEVQIACQTDKYLEDIVGSIDKYNCTPLQLLKAAHAITSKKMNYNKDFWANESKQALNEGKGDCRYFSAFTYSNFLYLAEQLGMCSMKDKVRMCIGYNYDDKKVNYGHAWLQVMINGEWHNYETTEDRIKKNETIDFKNLDEKIPDSEVIDSLPATACSVIKNDYEILEDKTDFLFSVKTGADLKKLLF